MMRILDEDESEILEGLVANSKGSGGSRVARESFENCMDKFSDERIDSTKEDRAYLDTAAKELVQIVDENNQPLYVASRAEMRSQNLRHRCTHALVRTSSNYFYVQKRSMLKDYCPGWYDPTPGGVVGVEESYDQANERECEEEMGIPSSVPKKRLFNFYYEDSRVRSFGEVYEVVYDGAVRLQKEEVESVHLMTMEDILHEGTGTTSGDTDGREIRFTPDCIAACRRYVQELPGGLSELKPTAPCPTLTVLP
jgi:isopentenyldiphosphate isomerase